MAAALAAAAARTSASFFFLASSAANATAASGTGGNGFLNPLAVTFAPGNTGNDIVNAVRFFADGDAAARNAPNAT